eukprot:comp22224_c0_seq1/m.32758 comp22224_c0_seq1/g.32758  ORF comp22224_c0_seq1/g.32758 comp22224_c0_seq1/m.32758 type:complete len:531 (-) comp22224_c0_seq1:151-1743(-)
MTKLGPLVAGVAAGLAILFAYSSLRGAEEPVDGEEKDVDEERGIADRLSSGLADEDDWTGASEGGGRRGGDRRRSTRAQNTSTPLGNLNFNDKESQNLLNLLYTIAEDQARKEGYVHRGLTCNSCQTTPIRGVRYKCANCVDFDLCETCEAQARHDKTHVLLKIRIPIPPLANPRSALLPVFYPGGKQDPHSTINPTVLRTLQKDTHFDQVELEALYEQFKSLSGSKGIDKSTFERCLGPLGVGRNLVTERIFYFFDQDGDGIIDFRELVCGLSVLCKGSQAEKIEYAFKGYDLDNSGFISRDELQKMFKAYFYLSMELVRDVIKAMEEEMMANFDDEGGKPVSAIFTAPIPRDGADVPQTKEDAEQMEDPFSLFSGSTSRRNNDDSDRLSDDTSLTRRTSLSQRRGMEAPITSDNRAVSPGMTSNSVTFSHDTVQRRDSAIQYSSSAIRRYPRPIRRRSSTAVAERFERGESWPVMEAMSQDAIEELVENAFKGADLDGDGLISYDEFMKWAEKDSTMTAWFEALGSVF